MLEVAQQNGFKFDASQLPINVMDAHFRSFSKLVVPEMVKQGIGVLAMKTLANGAIVKSGTVTPIEAIQYALSSVVICGIDNMEVLDQATEAARLFKPFSEEQLRKLLAKTAQAAATGKFEPFKTSSIYDGTAQNVEWMGEEPEEVKAMVG